MTISKVFGDSLFLGCVGDINGFRTAKKPVYRSR
jgi:hypothetical protein